MRAGRGSVSSEVPPTMMTRPTSADPVSVPTHRRDAGMDRRFPVLDRPLRIRRGRRRRPRRRNARSAEFLDPAHVAGRRQGLERDPSRAGPGTVLNGRKRPRPHARANDGNLGRHGCALSTDMPFALRFTACSNRHRERGNETAANNRTGSTRAGRRETMTFWKPAQSGQRKVGQIVPDRTKKRRKLTSKQSEKQHRRRGGI